MANELPNGHKPKNLLEKMFAPLFRKDPSYNNQYPSFITNIDKLNPDSRLRYDTYLRYIQVNQERKAAYQEYEQMDTDIIAAALDLWADDATQMNLEDGESFYVNCDNPEVKALLEELYFKTLHIDEHIWSIVRTFAKYGDYFVRVAGNEKEGVKYCDYSIHPSRVSRIDFHGEIARFVVDEMVNCNPWDFVHFRMPGAVQFPAEGEYMQVTDKEDLNKTENSWTYGTSAISKARKNWKQLNLLEDSLVLSRLSRAFKRNIFMVNTSGLNETAAWDLVDKISSLLKRNKAINNGTSMESYNTLMNPEEDIVIPVNNEKGNVNVQEIGGDVDIQHIADIDYTNNKIFADLKTPKPYLGFEDALNGRNTLRMLDVRYARTIKNLQRVLILGLEKIGRIHLSLLGLDPFGVEFSITLPYISTIEEAEKAEVLSNKLDAISKVTTLFDQLDQNKEILNKVELIKYFLGELGLNDEEVRKLLANQAPTEDTET